MFQAALEEAKDADPVYYRIIHSLEDDEAVVVCMQWFDEYDYDQARFLTEKTFPTEKEAQVYANNLSYLQKVVKTIQEGAGPSGTIHLHVHLHNA